MQLVPGDRLDYRFEAQRPVDVQHPLHGRHRVHRAGVARRRHGGRRHLPAPLDAPLLPAVGGGTRGRDRRLPHPAAAGRSRAMTRARRPRCCSTWTARSPTISQASRARSATRSTRLDAPIPDDATLRRCVGPPLRESFRWLLDTDDARRDRAGDRALPRAVRRPRLARERRLRRHPRRAGGAGRRPARDVPVHVEAGALRAADRDAVRLPGHSPACTAPTSPAASTTRSKLLAHWSRARTSTREHAIMIGDRSHDIRAARMNGARGRRAVGLRLARGTGRRADAIVRGRRSCRRCLREIWRCARVTGLAALSVPGGARVRAGIRRARRRRSSPGRRTACSR